MKKILGILLLLGASALLYVLFIFDYEMTAEEVKHLEKVNMKYSTIRHLNYVSAFVVGYKEAKRQQLEFSPEPGKRAHDLVNYKIVSPNAMPFEVIDIQTKEEGATRVTFRNRHAYTMSFCEVAEQFTQEKLQKALFLSIENCANGRLTVSF